jgi:hypothetical protein
MGLKMKLLLSDSEKEVVFLSILLENAKFENLALY